MIEKLFSSQILFKIMAEMFKHKNQALSIKQLIVLTGKNQANILRELEKLINYNLVSKSKQNNQSFYTLNTNNEYYEVLSAVFKKSTSQASAYKKVWTMRLYPPLLMSMVGKATVENFAQIFPSEITVAGNFWEAEKNTYFYNKQEIENTVSKLIKKAINNPTEILGFFRTAHEKAVDLKNFSAKYSNQALVSLPTTTLQNFHKQFTEKFRDFYGYGTVAILVGYSDDNPVYQQAIKIIKQETKNNPDTFSQYLIALTARPKQLEIDWQNIAICQLAQKIQKSKLQDKQKIKHQFKQELTTLVNQHGFLFYDMKHAGTVNIDYYLDIIMEKLDRDIKAELTTLQNYEKDVASNYEKLITKLNLSQPEQNVFQILRELNYYKWAREYSFLHALYNIRFTQDELAKRCKVNDEDFMFVIEEELEDFFINPKKYSTIIKDRKKFCLIFNHANGKNECYAGQEAQTKITELKFDSKKDGFDNTDQLKGTPAFSGQAKGKVKIINIVKHLGKMEDGNILVSVATTPDLLPAMKRSRAIITDEGGITCHAAIVARELKIPCIVGVKNATKILSDGDEVLVDANKGIIKIIK
jgi:phosphohistidine swiveling domain-containing protein